MPARRARGTKIPGPNLIGSEDRRDEALTGLVSSLTRLDRSQLNLQWRNHLGGAAPGHLPAWLLMRLLAYRLQTEAFGEVDALTWRKLRSLGCGGDRNGAAPLPFAQRLPATRDGVELRPGALLTREWRGRLERVAVLEDGFAWNGVRFGSLSQIAKAITGTTWNGHRFFGLRAGGNATAVKGITGEKSAAKRVAAKRAPTAAATTIATATAMSSGTVTARPSERTKPTVAGKSRTRPVSRSKRSGQIPPPVPGREATA